MTELDLKNTLISFSWDEVIHFGQLGSASSTPSYTCYDFIIKLIKDADETEVWKLVHNWISTEVVLDAIGGYHFSDGCYLAYYGDIYGAYYHQIKGTLQVEFTAEVKKQYTIDDLCDAYYSYVHHTKQEPVKFSHNRYHALYKGLQYEHTSGDSFRKIIVDIMYAHYPSCVDDYSYMNRYDDPTPYKNKCMEWIKNCTERPLTYFYVDFAYTIDELLHSYPDVIIANYRDGTLFKQDTYSLEYLKLCIEPLLEMYKNIFKSHIQLLNSYNVSTDTLIHDICVFIRDYDSDVSDDDRFYRGAENLYDIVNTILYCEFDPDKLRGELEFCTSSNSYKTPWPVRFRQSIQHYLDGYIAKTATKRYVITESEYTVHTKTYIVDVDLSKKKDLNTDEKALAKLVKSLKDDYTGQHTETYKIHKVESTKILNGDELNASVDVTEGADS